MSLKVLIVDPDWHFLAQARNALEARGDITVHEARPDQAVRRAEHWCPDLVIINAELRDCCDGDLLERLSRLSPRPAILLTAGVDQFAKAWRAWQRGGDELLLKPLMHPGELHVAVLHARENMLVPRRLLIPAQPVAVSA